MMLSAGDQMLIIACLQWAAMEHEKISKDFIRQHKNAEAFRAAAFSGECARLADLLRKAN